MNDETNDDKQPYEMDKTLKASMKYRIITQESKSSLRAINIFSLKIVVTRQDFLEFNILDLSVICQA